MKRFEVMMGALAFVGLTALAHADDGLLMPPYANATVIGKNVEWGMVSAVSDFEVDHRLLASSWTTPASAGALVSRPFADYYSFTLAEPMGFRAQVLPFNFVRDEIAKFDVALFTYEHSDYLVPTSSRHSVAQLMGEANDDSSDSFALVMRGGEISIDTPEPLLNAGNYFLAVSGKVIGMEAGRYFGESAFIGAANVIPEPQTWVMIVLGAGMVGFALTRHRHSRRA